MRAACALLANVTFCVCARAESFFFLICEASFLIYFLPYSTSRVIYCSLLERDAGGGGGVAKERRMLSKSVFLTWFAVGVTVADCACQTNPFESAKQLA
jgi:hypothetical protein